MLKGNDLILSIDGVRLAASKSCSVDRSVDTIEVCSPVDGPAKRYIPTTTGWSISANGLYANRDGYERLRKMWRMYQQGEATFIHVNVTTEGVCEEGDAILTSLNEDGSVNDLVKFSIQLQGSGSLTKTGTPLTLKLAKEDATINLDGPDAVIEEYNEQVDYVNINASRPFVLDFKYVAKWMLLPGVHADWEQDLDDYDEHFIIFASRVGYGTEGVSRQFAAGQYVLYADNGTDYVGVNIIEE